MRELTVRIRFTKASLGNVKKGDTFHLPRNPQGYVTFLAGWHRANLRFAAAVLNIHHEEVEKIHWDIAVDGAVRDQPWYRRYYKSGGGRSRFVQHEAFFAGQEVGVNCVVPSTITDDEFWRLMAVAGQYRGLSPARPGEYGFFEVVGLRPRRPLRSAEDEEDEPQGDAQAVRGGPETVRARATNAGSHG